LRKTVKPYKIRREGSFVNGFRLRGKKMRAILILVIALMLIFTSGCDFKYGKDKSKKISGAKKSSKGVAAFREKQSE
jgi:hypothetical protein